MSTFHNWVGKPVIALVFNTSNVYSTVLAMLMGACTVLAFPRPLAGQHPIFGCPVVSSYELPVTQDTTYHARLADPRINYLTAKNEYICRWHLERRDPEAASSDVLHPIVYVVDAPAEWVSTIIAGVNAWLPVFDAIGFRHALTVHTMTPADTALHENVVRISMAGEWGEGPNTGCQARSARGDLATCEIRIPATLAGYDGQDYCGIWGGFDPTIPLPCPDSILAFLVKGIVAHEVGHSLGLDHNYYAGGAYPTDSLRSPTFVHKWGWTPSVMLHKGYDEVLQPGDRVPLSERWLQVGPQDYWAIAWGYRPIPNASTPDAEDSTLKQWQRTQDTAPYLRIAVADVYGNEGDDGSQIWGGDDQLKAMPLWFSNAALLLDRLFPSGSVLPPHAAPVTYPASQRLHLDSLIVGRWWRRRLLNVAGFVGGRVAQVPYPDNPADSLRTLPLPGARQLAALRMVLASALYGQDAVIRRQRAALHEAQTSAGSSSDSIPIVFDSVEASQSHTIAAWRITQHDVLTELVQHVAELPADVQPAACRDLSAAIQHLTSLASSTTGSRRDAVEDLYRILANAQEALGPCH